MHNEPKHQVSLPQGSEVYLPTIFFVSIEVLPSTVDLIRGAGVQMQQKQLYFNVTGIGFAEESILKWA